jgi:hypothetical protein
LPYDNTEKGPKYVAVTAHVIKMGETRSISLQTLRQVVILGNIFQRSKKKIPYEAGNTVFMFMQLVFAAEVALKWPQTTHPQS